MVEFATSVSLKDISNEQVVNKFKLSNLYVLKFINGLVKNHRESQVLIAQYNMIDLLY
jgi:hypothetical protein